MNKFVNILILLSINSMIFAQLTPGQIGSDQLICYGSAPLPLTFTTAPTGGTTPYTYRWQRSNDSGTNWYDITGTSAARLTYSPPVLGKTTLFRCMITDAAAASVITNPATITVRVNLNAGIIGSSQTLYFNTSPNPLTQQTAPSGGSGSYTYRWQSSTNGSQWADIPGATSAGYSPSVLNTETWFRRFVIDAGCGSTATNSVRMTINSNPITLYTTEIPAIRMSDVYYDLGTEFEALSDGVITSVRLYSHIDEVGVHQIRIWRQNDQSAYELITGPIDWSFSTGITGWRTFELPSSVSVEEGRNYIVSITSGAANNVWVQSNTFSPVATNNYVRYLRGLFAGTPGTVPGYDYGAGYFRDIVFIPFSSGSAGTAQSICYNTVPVTLSQIESPSGASGIYSQQWQSSPDSIIWTDIPGATSSDYSPPALTTSTYFRREVTSGAFIDPGHPVLITVDPQFSLAQLNENITIYENTATDLNVAITGGTPPYTVNFTMNGTPQTAISDYTSGTDIYTGLLAAGTYIYTLTSVTDAFGCEVQSRGNPVTVTVSGAYSGSGSARALVLVNSGSSIYYGDYTVFIKAYLDWFGIPYELHDVSGQLPLPDFNNYAVIIFGHRNVYSESFPAGQQYYPISALETAISGGVGLYSFDQHLFDYASAFNVSGATHPAVTSSQINFLTDHYITQLHQNDIYHTTNNTITLKDYGGQQTITVASTIYSLGGTNQATLATVSDGVASEALLQATSFGNGRIVKWSAYDWVNDNKLGPIFGMDDLIWRGIVWAARKPFVIQGLPPMITMRVDDVDGTRTMAMDDLEWLKISNEYGFIPWVAIFTESGSANFFGILKDLIDRNLATASPHAVNYDDQIYFNIDNVIPYSVADSVIKARNIFAEHQLTMSKYLITHNYLLDSDALPEIRNMGIEFIGTRVPYDRTPGVDYPGEWLMCGPYRLPPRTGWGGPGVPIFYSGTATWPGGDFFFSLTEIGDDGGYEWYPVQDVASNIARGVRHLRRALNGMFLPVLFTHEDQIISSATEWRQILSGITTAVSSYNPEYKSMDYAVRYGRAKENINITNVTSDNGLVSISCSGINDMATKCYLFTESGSQISYRLITLPQVTSNTTPVTVGVLE